MPLVAVLLGGALLVLLLIGVLLSGGGQPDARGVPVGLATRGVDAVRDGDTLSLVVSGSDSDGVRVAVCPGLVPGPSDAAGITERVRVSGCLDAAPAGGADPESWTVRLGGLDPDQAGTFDSAERWLVIVVDPSRSDDARLAGAWIPGGPLLP